jgi:hypothetical protein
MSTFQLEAGAYTYRPLRRPRAGGQMQRGWDVFALQRSLMALGYDLSFKLPDGSTHPGDDGSYGDATDAAVRRYQEDNHLWKDGIAGTATQGSILRALARRAESQHDLPDKALQGQLEYECGNQLGNYTAPYDRPNDPRVDKSRDLGATERNRPNDPSYGPTWHDDAVLRQDFDPPKAIAYMVADPDRGIRPRFERYRKQLLARGVNDVQLAWELAIGSWNQPGTADAVAAGKRQLPDSLRIYISRATAYVTSWPA